MKKLLVILSLFVLMTAGVMAQVEPIVTNVSYTNTAGFDFASYGEVSCEGISTSEMWCHSGGDVFIFDKDTSELTTGTGVSSYDPSDACKYYSGDGMLYCMGRGATPNTKVNPSDGTETALTDFTGNYGASYDCSLRIGTDEIYCWGGSGAGSESRIIRKYDISEDSVAHIAITLDYLGGTGPMDYVACDFVTSDVLVCYGGYTAGGTPSDGVMEYSISGNSSVIVNTGTYFVGGSCNAFEGILYCAYGADENEEAIEDGIFYYDYTTNTFGTLTATLPTGATLFGDAGVIGTTVYNLGAYYGAGWDESNDIFRVRFDYVRPEEPTFQHIGNISTPVDFEGTCYYAEGDIYCVVYGETNILIYSDTPALTDTGNDFPMSIDSDEGACWYDTSLVYCFGHRENTVFKSFSMSVDGSSVTWFANFTGTTNEYVDCRKRPDNDEVWCYGSDGSYNNKLYKYDMTGDSWTLISTDDSGDTDYGTFWYPECDWRNSAEFYCYGGYADTETSNYLMKHIVATNTTTFTQNPNGVEATSTWTGRAGHNVLFIDDIFYIFAGETYDWPTFYNQVFYYDPAEEIFSELTTALVGTSYHGWAYADGVLTFIGGQNDLNRVDTLTWDLVQTPEDGGTVTENTTYEEGNYSVPNNFTVSGDDITVDFSGSVVSDGNIVITGNNVVVTGLIVEEALVVTGSNVDYSSVERVGVTFTEFRVSDDTTDLITEVDLTDVDLTLETTDALIDFTQNVDLTVYGDLDAVIETGVNSITVDSVSAPNLDVTARLTFYNTGYQTEGEVLIYKNGELCTADCTLVSVNNGVVVVDVTGFSTYLLVGAGLDISQENFLTLRDNMVYILGAFATVVILIAAMIIMTFVFSGAQVDMTQIIVVVLMLAVGFAALLAGFVTIMRNFAVV